MAIKYLEAEKLRLETRKKLTATPENWMQFLRTASNTYKYSYSDLRTQQPLLLSMCGLTVSAGK